MTDRYRVAHISELEIKTGGDRPRWARVRTFFDVRAFGVNAWTAEEARQEVISEHDEVGGPLAGHHQELYFVVAGHALFEIAGDEVDAPAGTFVFVRDPAAKRRAVAKEPATTVLAVGGRKGRAFEPMRWERTAGALAHWETKDWAAAITELSSLHTEYPDDPGVLYNLACAESLGGRHQEALLHLSRAVALDSSFGELAVNDADFEPIRDEPEFQSAVAGQADAARPSS